MFRHSISRCESSDTSDVTSLSSLANSPTQAVKTSPELRRQSEIVSESREGADRAANAKSCPDLEHMVASSGLKIPGVREQVSPRLHRHRNRHRHTKSDQLPKFSISLEEAEAFALAQGLSDLAVSGTASLPASASPQQSVGSSQHCPEVPSPLVRGERSASTSSSMVKSSSATGLSLVIPPPGPDQQTPTGRPSLGHVNKNLIQVILAPHWSKVLILASHWSIHFRACRVPGARALPLAGTLARVGTCLL